MVDFGLFQTANEQMIRVLEAAQNIAMTPAPVLISGEQGVGKTAMLQFILEKSRFQRQLHRWSAFHRSFTADIKSGDAVVIEDLDEMNLLMQNEVSERIDQLKAAGVQVRWFATSTHSPAELVKQGHLRKDLFYRLSVIHLQIPSLKNRTEDIEVLSQFFIKVFCLMRNQQAPVLTSEASLKLMSYNWPGNVAELENVIERAVSLAKGSAIQVEHIQFAEMDQATAPTVGATLSEMERKLILQTLQVTAQNKTKAAQILGISIRTLRNKLNEYREAGVI